MTGGEVGGFGPADTFGTCSCRSAEGDDEPSGTLLVAAALVAVVVVAATRWFSFITDGVAGT